MEFTLRPLKTTDLGNLVKYANNYEIAKFLTNKFPHPYTEESGKGFIEFTQSANPPHVLAIDLAGEFVGAIGVHQKDDIECKNAEMGYWLAEPFWNKGIISRAIPQMVAYGFKHWDIDRIFARPFGTNLASQKALEKSGFILEARFKQTLFKFGRYEDELIYAIRRERTI